MMSYHSVKGKVIQKCWGFWAEHGPSLTKFIDFDSLARQLEEDERMVGRAMDDLRDEGILDLRGMGKPVEYRLLRRPSAKIPTGLQGNYMDVLHVVSGRIRNALRDSGFGTRLDPIKLAKELKCDEELTLWACEELADEEYLRDTGLTPVVYEVVKEPPYFPLRAEGSESRKERDEDVS